MAVKSSVSKSKPKSVPKSVPKSASRLPTAFPSDEEILSSIKRNLTDEIVKTSLRDSLREHVDAYIGKKLPLMLQELMKTKSQLIQTELTTMMVDFVENCSISDFDGEDIILDNLKAHIKTLFQKKSTTKRKK